MKETENAQQRVEIRLTNSSDRPRGVVLEPWGEIYEMEPHTTYRACGEGPVGDTLEIEIQDGWVKVWGWGNSSLEICKADDGSPLRPIDADGRPLDADVPVPEANSERLERVRESEAPYDTSEPAN